MFTFELAEKLGKTVKQLDAELGEGELLYWFAKELIHPSGERAKDLRAGIVASTTFNSAIKPEKWLSNTDFIPWRRKPRKKRSSKALTRTSNRVFSNLASMPDSVFEANRRNAPRRLAKSIIPPSQRDLQQGAI